MSVRQTATTSIAVSEPSHREGDIPVFPWFQMIALSFGMLAHSCVFTEPLPFVAFMVVDFGLAKDVDSAGYYAGWITGTFMIGRVIAAIPWGLTADRIGRRPCLLASMFNIALFGICFGLSTNFTMAILARLAVGLGNGFMAIAKTVISEITTCKDHEARGFGIINGIWGLGLIVGPAVGGLLSRPAIQYPTLFSSDSVFATFPYLLPSIISSSIAIAAGISIYTSIPETLTTEKIGSLCGTRKSSSNNDSDSNQNNNFHSIRRLGQIIQSKLGISQSNDNKNSNNSSGNRKSQYNVLSTLSAHGATSLHGTSTSIDSEHGSHLNDRQEATLGILGDRSEHALIAVTNPMAVDQSEEGIELTSIATSELPIQDSTDNINSTGDSSPTSEPPQQDDPADPAAAKKPSTFKEIFADISIRNTFFIYLCQCFIVMFVDESLPLWAVTSAPQGGLAWTAAQVGETLASIGGLLVIFQLFLYERFMRLCCTKDLPSSMFYLDLFAAAMMVCLPFVAAGATAAVIDSTSMTDSEKTLAIQAAVVLVLVVYRIGATAGFSILGVATNNSVSKEMRATINGIMMVGGSMGNAMGPIVGSYCYALTTTLNQQPNQSSLQPASTSEQSVPLDGRLTFLIGGFLMICLACSCKLFLK